MAIAAIDRHVLASNASSFDTAWRTFGWTPALAGEPASRLEEQVPWATRAAAAESPARLSGAADAVLNPANTDQLDFAFQPLEGRHAFSVWGAIGDACGPAGEWRVLTHTLLFDEALFHAIDGYPFGLFQSAANTAAAWFRGFVEEATFKDPTPLEPIELSIDRALHDRMRGARLREIARLSARLISLMGGAARLEVGLGATYEALAHVRKRPGLRHVALRASDDAASVRLLARLAWLTLPIDDRIHTSFTTEQRKAQQTRASLLVLPATEWGSFVPEGALLVDGKPRGGISSGRAFWATVVTATGQDSRPAADRLRRLDGRAGARAWSLLDRDDPGRARGIELWRHAWRSEGPSRSLVERLASVERGADGGRRRRVVGHVAALALMAEADAPLAWLLDLARTGGADAAQSILRAAIRTLQRGRRDARVHGAMLRCEAVATGLVGVQELVRLSTRERPAAVALVASANGREALARATAIALLDAPIVGLSIVASLGSFGYETQQAQAFTARLFQDVAGRIARSRQEGERSVVSVVSSHSSERASEPDVDEALLRLLWSQPDKGAAAAAKLLDEHPDVAPRLLAGLMVAPAPLPTFRAIRRLLLARASHPSTAHNVAVHQRAVGAGARRTGALIGPALIERIDRYSPALAAHLQPELPAEP